MNTIGSETRISELLEHPESLDLLVRISPKFSKLRNPILRRIMATRTTVQMACSIAGCPIDEFMEQFRSIGFVVTDETTEENNGDEGVPEWIVENRISELDVRPILDSGKDPLKMIMHTLKALEAGKVLKVINSFKPFPLIQLLGESGYDSYTEQISDDCVNTYFHKKADHKDIVPPEQTSGSLWNDALARFAGRYITIAIHDLEPPKPMIRILEELVKLPEDHALFVNHLRVPVFLFPELDVRGFSYVFKEQADSGVQIIIYRK